MNIFGLTIARTKTLASALDNRGAWYPIVREGYPGAWQQNVEIRNDTVLSHNAVYSCITLIASDVAKNRCRLVETAGDDIWTEVTNTSHSPVLRRPNRYQNRIQFFTWWVVSKLAHGNTYVLKQRDNRGVVSALYILNPTRVKPLVSDDGEVFYEIQADNLTGLQLTSVTVPASEVIHDVMVPLFHPLVGVSPIFACGLAAVQGLRMQEQSTKFFENGSRPGGVLMVPGHIKQDQAEKLKEKFEDLYTGTGAGKLAVLADGVKYQPMAMSAVDSQLIEQLRWTAENVCSCFHVPIYKIDSSKAPNFNSVEALDQQYYSQCLQIHIESIELLLDEGLGLPENRGTEFDLDGLIRMDTSALVKSEKEAGGLKTVNESRKRLGLPPVKGGDTVFRQQQDFSLEALNRRDSQVTLPPVGASPPEQPADDDDEDTAEDAEKSFRNDVRMLLAMKSAEIAQTMVDPVTHAG